MQVSDIDKRLQTLEVVEQKVDSLDRDMKKMSAYIYDNEKETREKIHGIEEKLEYVSMSAGLSLMDLSNYKGAIGS